MYALFLYFPLLPCIPTNQVSVPIIQSPTEITLIRVFHELPLSKVQGQLSVLLLNNSQHNWPLTHLLQLNVKLTLNPLSLPGFPATSQDTSSQSHLLSHFFEPDLSMLEWTMAYFPALFLTFSVSFPRWYHPCHGFKWHCWLKIPKSTFSSPDLMPIPHK